ncbi:unnamed protein product [Dovyalis caffra]|uniref:Uncharacterized protein n=1 Tax=Dovyalis caffra TaxID=77055 RepID=A0AAV1RFG4_9ROSI|nr:unnamed protein product [Dovyalis caffra]
MTSRTLLNIDQLSTPIKSVVQIKTYGRRREEYRKTDSSFSRPEYGSVKGSSLPYLVLAQQYQLRHQKLKGITMANQSDSDRTKKKQENKNYSGALTGSYNSPAQHPLGGSQ